MNKEINKLDLIEYLVININKDNILKSHKKLLKLLKELECNELNFNELKAIIALLILDLGVKHYKIDSYNFTNNALQLIIDEGKEVN